MTPEMTTGLYLLAASGAVGWAFKTQDTITQHQSVINKLDQLLTILLEDRLGNSTPNSRHESYSDPIIDGLSRLSYEGGSSRQDR